jgi:Transposase
MRARPLMCHIARQQQDYTTHKSDEADCVLIARLACELHCYIPEELDEAWAQLRHLGRRRAQLITSATASVQRTRDFLSVAWPVAPEACKEPFESVTWLAAMQVVTSRCGGQPVPRARSPAARPAPSGTCAAGRRVSTITWWPSSCSRGTAARPSTPVPPVTITRAITCSVPQAVESLPAPGHPAAEARRTLGLVEHQQGAVRRTDPGLDRGKPVQLQVHDGDPGRVQQCSQLICRGVVRESGDQRD